MKQLSVIPVLLLTALLWVNPVQADGVPAGYRQIAAEEGVPAELLYAVALTESKKQVDDHVRPWPWTLNIAGRAHYYPTRVAAHRALMRELNLGATRIDIGLLQISWHYHRQRFRHDPWQALDPYLNIRVGARYLRELYLKYGDWWQAVGRYHSANTLRRAVYRLRVAAELLKIRGREYG
jgi:hypothetical protein